MAGITQLYKIVLGAVELFFAIPLLGGAIILAHAWTPLGVLIVLHLIGLFLSFGTGKSKSGHVIGIVGNALAVIPVLGMILHFIIGIVNLYQGIRNR